jgi:glycosyltransferase involved in cell wall biosynthesis
MKPKIALVHDHLVQDGGAEQVVRALLKAYPDAPLYTLVYDPAKMALDFNKLAKGRIRTSDWQKHGWAVKHYKWLLSRIDAAFRKFDLSEYDIVISSSSGWAKSVQTGPDTLHVCYCHTPIRYIWSSADSYIAETGYPAPLKWGFKKMLGSLRRKDLRAAKGVDEFIANSDYVAKRIKKYYGCSARVINPPVNLAQFAPSRRKGDYYFVASRLVPYKRIDLAIKAANKLKRPLKVMGTGVDLKRLEGLAGPTVEFTGRVSDAQRKKLFAEARAVLNPQEEDFGITTVEALASGTPVIAYDKGGAAEILENGRYGVLFKPQSVAALVKAFGRFERKEFSPRILRERSKDFSETKFKNAIRKQVSAAYAAFKD